MRKKECERDEAFAWQVLRNAVYATISMVDDGGKPYAVPVNIGADEDRGALYFHCANGGEKLEILQRHPAVCVSAVSRADVVTGEFTMSYASAVVQGEVCVVQDKDEKIHALRILCRENDPAGMEGFDSCVERYLPHTCIVKILPRQITAKSNIK